LYLGFRALSWTLIGVSLSNLEDHAQSRNVTRNGSLHSSLGDRTPIEYENAYYNGELPGPEDEPEQQANRGPDGRYRPRNHDQDINPRVTQNAG
jgi:hypothetical protein